METRMGPHPQEFVPLYTTFLLHCCHYWPQQFGEAEPDTDTLSSSGRVELLHIVLEATPDSDSLTCLSLRNGQYWWYFGLILMVPHDTHIHTHTLTLSLARRSLLERNWNLQRFNMRDTDLFPLFPSSFSVPESLGWSPMTALLTCCLFSPRRFSSPQLRRKRISTFPGVRTAV